MGIWLEGIEVDVAAAVGATEPVYMRGWARGSSNRQNDGAATPVVYCLAGGGCSTGYFDLDVDAESTYSMADYFAERGAIVVSLDHLGIGRSDGVEDLYSVTPGLLARCHDVAVEQVLESLRAERIGPVGEHRDRLEPVGLGHSMGGLIATIQQGRYRSFSALVLLGHGTGLPEVLTSDELAVSGPDLSSIEDEIVSLARTRFASGSTVPRKRPRLGAFITDDVPAQVRQAFTRQAVPLLPTCGLASMIPRSTHAERVEVTAPTFFGFGDRDLLEDYTGTMGQYPRVRDAALYVLEGSGHCHNLAGDRRLLWDRILAWLAIRQW